MITEFVMKAKQKWGYGNNTKCQKPRMKGNNEST